MSGQWSLTFDLLAPSNLCSVEMMRPNKAPLGKEAGASRLAANAEEKEDDRGTFEGWFVVCTCNCLLNGAFLFVDRSNN